MPRFHLYPQTLKENKQTRNRLLSPMKMLFYTRDLVSLKIIGEDILGPSSQAEASASNTTARSQGRQVLLRQFRPLFFPFRRTGNPWLISTVGTHVTSLLHFQLNPKDSMNTFLFKCSITFLLRGQIPLKWETQTK